jgi:hypothetical protein
MAALNPSSKPYSDPATLAALEGELAGTAAANGLWPDGPLLFRHNSKTNMTSLRPPNVVFPEQLPPPTGLPIRPPSQDTNFPELDTVYNKSLLSIFGSHGMSCGSNNEEEDERRNQVALKTLEQHIKARMPYIRLASARIQAACGVRNELPFDLPELPKRNLSPNMQALYNMPKEGFANSATSGMDKGGVKAKPAARGGRKDNGIGFLPKSPVGMQVVDKETGKGLREFLLQQGKERGMRKQKCKSIAFHDFTPDIRTGNHRNVLLGHYSAEKGERVDVYEVDL